MITGNKGEWSEIYTLFKLLGEGKVHAGDAAMNKLPLYYPILNVIRKESKEYEYKPNIEKNIVIILEDGTELAHLSMNKFIEESKLLLDTLQKPEERAFSVPHTESFMHEIGCSRLKAPSCDKADIHIIIHDLRTNMTPNLGFSIKSQLGSPSTLLNPGKSTNIRFKVCGITNDEQMNELNKIGDHIGKIKSLYQRGYSLLFDDYDSEQFKNNLLFIDSNLPILIAESLIENSKNDKLNDVASVIKKVAERNPFAYKGSNNLVFYEHKIKQLLIDTALGMTPNTEWNGKYDANGGYLVVRKDGEIVCYHFYNRNEVEDYLYNNTRFDRASRERYDFGYIYKRNNEYYLKLNLQIRFKK